MFLRALLVAVSLAGVSSPAAAQVADPDPESEAARREQMARAFAPLTRLFVVVRSVGSVKELGLDAESLAVRERVEEALPHMMFVDGIESDEVSLRDTGQVMLRVWTMGTETPMAYHLEIAAGPLSDPSIYASETLGVTGRTRFRDDLEEAIEALVRRFALLFMGVRGEL